MLQDFLIPAEVMNIEKHGSGSIGIIRHMYGALGQIPDQPGIHRTEE